MALVNLIASTRIWHAKRVIGLKCLVCGFLASTALTASAHDSFLRPVDFLPADTGVIQMVVFNGTYASSLDSIPADAVETVSVQTPSGKTVVGEYQWRRGEPGSRAWRVWQRVRGYLGEMDLRRTSELEIRLDEEGLFTIGLALHEMRAALSPETFAFYMEESGLHGKAIPPVLTGDANQIVRERYTKTCKTMISTGSGEPGDPTLPLGLEVEIVPLSNPFLARPGDRLEFQALLFGKPLSGQVILAGRNPEIFESESDHRVSTTTGSDGKFSLLLDRGGEWWVKYSHIAPADGGDIVDLVTHWTTLTFIIP